MLGQHFPPIGPLYLVRQSRCSNDRVLLLVIEALSAQASQRRFHQPGFEQHSCRVAIAVELGRHSQGFERTIHASWSDALVDDDLDEIVGIAVPCACVLDRGHGCSRSGAVTLETALGCVQQERLGGGEAALAAILSHGHHLAKHGLVRRTSLAPARSPARVAALALLKPRGCWRPPVAHVVIALAWTGHWRRLAGHFSVSASRVQRLSSEISFSSIFVRPLRLSAA